LAGAAAATLLVLAVPAPAAAAPTPTVTITDVTVAEGTGGVVTARFTIQVVPHPRACCAVQVNWATAPGLAEAPADYITSSGTVSLTKTAFSRVISVPVNPDFTDEENETFAVNLTNLVGTPGQIGDPQGVATITDDDLPPLLSVNDVAITEGDAGTTTATFNASLSVLSGKDVTLDWATSADSATVGVDYTASSGSETIPAGAAGATIDVTVNGDVVDEPDESFGITLSNSGNASIADGSGVGTITDDDPLPLLSIGDASITEGNIGAATLTFDITLSSASGKTVTVDWATADDSAVQPDDYNAGSGTATFTPGDTSETIDVSVNGDIVPELDETFLVVLSSPSDATLGDGQGVGTIEDDELQAVIDIDDPSVAEGPSGTTTLSFSVTLSNPSASSVTVDWATAAGTATAPADYLDDANTVTFAPLETSKVVEVTVNGDATYEGDETNSLTLSNSTGAPIGDEQGIGTIVNDDAAPVVSVSNASILEGNAGTSVLTFGVSLTGDSELDASLDFATANATATGTDYVAASDTVTIPAGETTGTVDVVVNGDLVYESNETFSLTLSNPADAVIGDGAAQGTIINDDKAPTTVTLAIGRAPKTVVAKGLLEPTKAGHRVTATLFRKRNGTFVKIAAKTVLVRFIRDRDSDGKTDGSYRAPFLRPKAAGTYKVLVQFKGTSTHKPCSRTTIFTLRAT
jgi:hypothetical protein